MLIPGLPYLNQLDDAILLALADWRSPWLNRAAASISFLGSPWAIMLVSTAAFAFLWLMLGDRIGAARIATAAAGAEILVEVIKGLLARPRPTVVPHLVEFTGFSYPSGHALVASATYGTLAAIACAYVQQPYGRIAIQFACWAVAALVATSRVYLGVHYPSDVAGGVVLGVAWVYCTAYLWQRRNNDASRQSD
jgi:undecaprenyl-diphosphatase